jgi:hypothetical protein
MEQEHETSVEIFVRASGHPEGESLRGSVELYIAMTTGETPMYYRLCMKTRALSPS